MTVPEDRCRLVLIAQPETDAAALAAQLESALSGGDVASVVLVQRDLDDRLFQTLCAEVVPIIQKAGAAALIAGDSRVAGRVKADGLFILEGPDELGEAVARHSPAMIVGGGQPIDRDKALALGEKEPDFVFFGRIDGDSRAQPHARNVELAEWWAGMVDIPCILMGGSDASATERMAETGAEFIAFGRAVFDAERPPADMVRAINRVLDEKAPRFQD